MAKLAKQHDGKLVVVCSGLLTNVARFIKEHPEEAKKVKPVRDHGRFGCSWLRWQAEAGTGVEHQV